MELNNFEKLTLQARRLDTGIEHLSKMSKVSNLIGCIIEENKETNVHIEALWNSIHNIQKRIDATTLEVDNYNTEELSTEQFLQETRNKYQSLKEQCENMELIFEQYGYRYDNNDTSDQQSANNTNISEQEIVEEATKTLEDEFLPKYNANQKEQTTSISNMSSTSNLLTSPISENSTSLSKDISLSRKDYLSTPMICTPVRERPKEAIYSKHFYKFLKK